MSLESTADGEVLQLELLAPEAALADVSATILLPKGLQELTMEREWELGTLERGVPQKHLFALKRSVSVEELPKLMLRVDANGIGRAFRAKFLLSDIREEVAYSLPSIAATTPLAVDSPKHLLITAEDDGGVMLRSGTTTIKCFGPPWLGRSLRWSYHPARAR